MTQRGRGRTSGRHHERIYRVVRAIPEGRVATYGQVAEIAGRCTPRMVGYAMASVPAGTDVPWHRVINSRGTSSLRGDGREVQMALLRAEGVAFDEGGRVDLGEFGWRGPGVDVERDIDAGRGADVEIGADVSPGSEAGPEDGGASV
jgi:methylated-DNA-protein-cysteine methyltransferase-like protein